MQIDWDEIRSRRTHDDLAALYGQQQENFYGDAGHFLFELLQNAEDALRERDHPRHVRFALQNGAVSFSHCGRPFTPADADAVSYFNRSTKNETDIGRFGIGFKSVYRVTDRPEIYSGDYSFAIEDYHKGFNIEPIVRDPDETIFMLPLKPAVDGEEVEAAFRRLEARLLLFLREIGSIEWTAESGASGYCRRDDKMEQNGVRRVRLREERGRTASSEETWLVFSRAVHNSGRPVGHVEIAFRIAIDKSGAERIEAVEDSRLTAFFPMEGIDTRLGMLIQGPYRTTAGRDNVLWPDAWNRYLVGETAELLVEALRYLRDHGLLGVHVYEALPLEHPRSERSLSAILLGTPPDTETRFAPYVRATLFEAVRDALKDEELLPAHRRGNGGGGSWIPASQAYLGTPELRNLVSRLQLSELWGDGDPAAWLASDIDGDRTPALHEHLVREQDVRDLAPNALVDALRSNEPFLAKQSDSWIQRLYAFLHDHGPPSRYRYGSAPLLHLDYADVPLIRLEDGTHVAPSSGSTPVAYLPTDPPSKFPNTVRPEVCSTRKAREFLESIGVQEPDRVDELIRGVLPKYREGSDIPSREYADDLRQIVGAYGAASGDKRGQLTEEIRKTSFVRAVDAGTGELSFALPGDVYAWQLLDLFEGVNDVLIARPLPRGVPAREAGLLFAACGVLRTLTPVVAEHAIERGREHPRFLHTELAALRRRENGGDDGINWQRDSWISDSTLRGLDGLINRLPELPSDDAERRARLLWDTLCATAQRSEAAFSARYYWYRHKERWVDVDSASVDLLNKNAWVPDGAGRLLRPSQVSLDDLGWQSNAFLESKVGFRPPVIDILAQEAGIRPRLLDAVKQAEAEGIDVNELLTEAVQRARGEARPLPTAEEAHPEDDTAPAPPGRVPTPQPPREPGVPPEAPPRPEGGASAPPRPEGGASAPATRARSGGAGSGKRTFRSYIEVREEGEDAPDPDGLSHEQRMALEDAAISLIVEREPRLQPTPPGTHGYDLYETDETGEIVRWVEVKSVRGGWDAGPVGLSHTQFGLAREKREAYWLYVVEHAGDAERASVVRIRDPAGRDSDYLFDDGWREAAGPEPPPPEASPA